MKKCLFGFFLFYSSSIAQTVENSIRLYATNFPIEKTYIHFDKEVYLPGETIWFKAYLFEENIPSEKSTNFYAALYDENGVLIKSHLSPIFNSTTDGHFDIPDSLESKVLICRAYTTWMMNFDTTFLFTKVIKLINKNAKLEKESIGKSVSLNFFPEGGDIIEGTRNTIAFKANYKNGLPFEISGVIKKKETGEVITALRSLHDGMGRFDLEIQPKEIFYAEWIDDKGTIQQTYLPKAKPEGISLKLVQQNNNLIFNIVNKLQNDSIHVLIYMYQKIFYKTSLTIATTEPYTGIVPIYTLPTGIAQLTVFDTNWQPIAERVAFINNNNFTVNTKIANKETSVQKRGKNIIEIDVLDTIPANMSLSITDAEINSPEIHSTIVTELLLSGDVKGYIYNPAYYFANNSDAVLKANLDLVMLTHGWRRYNWHDMLIQKMPNINYPDDNYLSVYGQIGKEILAKMPKQENVNLIIKTKDNSNNFYPIWPDSTGLLKQTGLIFYDTARVLYSFNKSKHWNTQMTFSTSNNTNSQSVSINNYNSKFMQNTGDLKFSPAVTLFNYYNGNQANQQFNKDKTLQTVVVRNGGWRNWKNDPIFKMDEKYTSGLFKAGSNAEAFDVLHDEMAEAKIDIYNYIGYKSRLLSIKYINGGKKLVMGVSGSGVSPLIFIDEHLVDPSELESLEITNIAYVKIIPTYFGTRDENNNLVTAVSIYLKKGDDLIDKRPKDTDFKYVKIAGYSPLKEFYSPDYSQSNTTLGTDARTTLLWVPYILTNAANHKILVTFYNNDFSKRFRVVLEGINDDGKLIHIEKNIE